MLLIASCFLGLAAVACGVIPFNDRPAAGYDFQSGAPLRIAVIDAAGESWSPAIAAAVGRYGAASSHLVFGPAGTDVNITITVRDYSDSAPPQLPGYVFPFNAGGFAAVYDSGGVACNFPPSTLPLNCSGEIATANVYLNDIIPAGPDIETRRERLILHELGHALGLARHSPDLDIDQLAQRYGWGD